MPTFNSCFSSWVKRYISAYATQIQAFSFWLVWMLQRDCLAYSHHRVRSCGPSLKAEKLWLGGYVSPLELKSQPGCGLCTGETRGHRGTNPIWQLLHFPGSGLLAHDLIREAARGDHCGKCLFLLTSPYSLYHSTVEEADGRRGRVVTKPAGWAPGWNC